MPEMTQACAGQGHSERRLVGSSAAARGEGPEGFQNAWEGGVPLVRAFGGPVPDEVLERLRHADSVDGAAGCCHLPYVAVELGPVDVVEVEGVPDKGVAQVLVLCDELGDRGELFAVADLALEKGLVLFGDVAVQPLEPVDFGELRLGIGGEPAQGLEQAVARVVLVPAAIAPADRLEEAFLFGELPACVESENRRVVGRDQHEGLPDLKYLVGVVLGALERMAQRA